VLVHRLAALPAEQVRCTLDLLCLTIFT